MPTEIESRYLIPDRLLFDRLRRLEALGSFVLQRVGKVVVADDYLDTRDQALLQQAWACRLRSEGGVWLATLKGPARVVGSIVHRPEYEITLPRRTEDVASWPRGELRRNLAALTGGRRLRRLVSIQQARHKHLLLDEGRPVAELSLDVVRTLSDGLDHTSFMLECELLESGQVADLERLDQVLLDDFGLVPESRSKLRRALDLIEGSGPSDDELLAQARSSSVDRIVARYGIDRVRAQQVAQRAVQLFDLLQEIHGLGQAQRPLLHTAAVLHNLGGRARRRSSHEARRDVLLRLSIEELDAVQQRTVAAAAYLHRRKITPARITQVIPDDWPLDQSRETLTIAALVRLAAALDDDSPPRTEIHEASSMDETVRIVLSGPLSAKHAQRAQRRSDLWEMLYPVRLAWGSLQEDGGVALAKKAQSGLGIQPWDSMQEAARKVLRFHFQRMLDHEAGTRLGEDPEELHDMRVATRRMRSALGLFGPYLTGALVTRVSDLLRQAGRLLGDVRDMDVALERAQAFADRSPDGEKVDLEPLLRRWRAQRERSRRRMLRYLDGRTYRRLVQAMRELLDELVTPEGWASEERAVSQVAPRFLYVAWRVVSAYDAVLENAPIELLHALRIDSKRLRYGLEFMSDVLPQAVVALIPEVVALQDHLGEMHDAAVAVEMLDAFLERRASGRYPGVKAYREACEDEMNRRLETFPELWCDFSRQQVRKTFRALARLRL